MNINSDINVLGSLPDWNLIYVFLTENYKSILSKGGIHSFTAIKTGRSVMRFEKAIKSTFLHFRIPDIDKLFSSLIIKGGINHETMMFLFWNASQNNELLHYLNEKVYFPAFYSGRVSIKTDEVVACIKDLKQTEVDLQKWSEITITTTASKYLTLLKKFGLMEGSVHKTIIHPYLSDEMFVVFVYWMTAVNEKPNLLKGNLLQYGFTELQPFVDRVVQKKFSKYFNIVYTGDKLNIEPLLPYESIYDSLQKS
jgi:hypothetical protein